MSFPVSRRCFDAPALAVAVLGLTLKMSAAEPTPAISYVGNVTVDARADGGLRPVVGVHNIQVFRANRTASEHADGLTDTYSHQPMLAWWNGRFHLTYLSGPRDEHQAPCSTSYMTSADGLVWERPRVIFPSFKLADGTMSVMHQRMGFFTAPDGRLLALGFHGKAPSPNDGSGIGRVVREVKKDGTFGRIHFIRFNAGWSEASTPYPLFSRSTDAGFVAACEALLANRVLTQQWWEEDSDKERYPISGKAMSSFTRRDGAKVAIWKNRLTSVTRDEGRTWTPHVFAGNMPNNASKYWLQRMSDGRVALALNPTDRWRHPLAVMSSGDDEHFDGLFAVHGELPDQRFPGGYKNMGPQYVRGIDEGNGTPPGTAMWLTYSVNKEDIWVSRVPVPLQSSVDGSVNETFDELSPGTKPATWNIYQPKWASVQVANAGPDRGRALELRDEEPHDYARAVRVFPAARSVKASFKILARQANARLEIDVLRGDGARPVRIVFAEDGHLRACHEGIWNDLGTYAAERWLSLDIDINPARANTDRYDLFLGGTMILPRAGVFTEAASTVERISFRTGAYRERGYGGTEFPDSDRRSAPGAFLIDDVVITPRP